jgi:uncharacterized Zn ribbon protein
LIYNHSKSEADSVSVHIGLDAGKDPKFRNQTLKQGTVIRSIRLTDDPDEIDCRHDTIKGLVLRSRTSRVAVACISLAGRHSPVASSYT